MNTEAIVVHVSAEVAAAYRDASAEDRQELDQRISLRLAKFLRSGKFLPDAAEQLETIVIQVSPDAAAAYCATRDKDRRKVDLYLRWQLAELLALPNALEEATRAMGEQVAATINRGNSDRQDSASLPISLKIVAVLFILGGISSMVDIIIALLNHTISLNVGILGLFIGGGLLRLSRGWRTCGLVFLWIAIVLCPIIVAAFILVSRLPEVTVLGQHTGTISMEIALAFAAIAYALVLWQYHVLTRPDIRRLFGIVDSCRSSDLRWNKR
jgi:hypothetical protein